VRPPSARAAIDKLALWLHCRDRVLDPPHGPPPLIARNAIDPTARPGYHRANATIPLRLRRFLLTTRVTVAPAGPAWLHEIKYDGYRLMVRRTSRARGWMTCRV
jgi:hypothetical protein